MQKGMRPVFSSLDQTTLGSKGPITWPKEKHPGCQRCNLRKKLKGQQGQ